MSEITPRIDSIKYYYGPIKKKPKMGDRRTTKKHGPQVRVPQICRVGPYKGAWVVSNGRQCYEWVTPEEAYEQWPHLKNKHEKEDEALRSTHIR